MNNSKNATSSQPSPEVTLDDLLVNIQKSLSRVSARSASIPEEQARSLIHGDVNFSIDLKVDGEGDKVIVRKDGQVNLSMSGRISTDIRNEEYE